MLPHALYFLLLSVLAADPAHLKPGDLSAHLGRIFLVDDVLWVHYLFNALVEIPGTLRTITDQCLKLCCIWIRLLQWSVLRV